MRPFHAPNCPCPWHNATQFFQTTDLSEELGDRDMSGSVKFEIGLLKFGRSSYSSRTACALLPWAKPTCRRLPSTSAAAVRACKHRSGPRRVQSFPALSLKSCALLQSGFALLFRLVSVGNPKRGFPTVWTLWVLASFGVVIPRKRIFGHSRYSKQDLVILRAWFFILQAWMLMPYAIVSGLKGPKLFEDFFAFLGNLFCFCAFA